MYPECKPHKEFDGLIEKFWMIPKLGDHGQSLLEILPDGHFALGFALWDSGCKVFVGGPCTKKAVIPLQNSREYFFVRFKPGKFPRIADVNPSDLVDQTADYLPRLLGVEADTLGERLLGEKTLHAKKQIIEAIFRSYGVVYTCQDRRCNRAAEIVTCDEGRLKVFELARAVGMSLRTLERLFLDQVGVTPKQFIRNVRFQRTLEKLKRGFPSTLGVLAHECGFADQSHLIKEFKTMAQRLPSAF